MEKNRIQHLLTAWFLEHANPAITCAYLFGSVARNDANNSSDVDIAILYHSSPPSTLVGTGVRIAGDLENILGIPVDVIVLNHADPDLIHRVLRDGVLLIDSNPDRRVEFEILARNRYFDLKPYLDEYRQVPSHARH